MQADFSVELGGDAPALEIPWRSDDPHVRYYDLKNHPELICQIHEAVVYPELGSFLSRINAAGFPMATAKCDAWASNELDPEEEIFGERKFVSYIDLVFIDERDRCLFEKHEAFAKELCRLLGYAPQIAATVELVIRHCYYHQENIVPANEAEQGGTLSSAVKDAGMSLPGNEAITHSGPVDITRCGGYEDIAPQGESARVISHGGHMRMIQNERANVTGQGKHVSATHKEDPNSTVTGFCLTAYVTGFGDSDHDPLRRWAIGLNLLQHAIVQLNSKPQSEH